MRRQVSACWPSLVAVVVVALFMTLPASAFIIHSPQLVAQSMRGPSLFSNFGSLNYGYDVARGALAVVPVLNSCAPLSFDAMPQRNVTTGLLMPLRATRPHEGKVMLLYYPDTNKGLLRTRFNRGASCAVAQSALWAQKQGAVGLLMQSAPVKDYNYIDAVEESKTATSLVRLFGGAVTIPVELITAADANTLQAAVDTYNLRVEASIGVSLFDGYSYV